MTKKYCKVSVIKREEDKENERGVWQNKILSSEVDTRGKGQMGLKNEQEGI